jgi:hypothetical protein
MCKTTMTTTIMMTMMTTTTSTAAAAAIWDTMLHSQADRYKCFRAICSLHLQDRWKQYILLNSSYLFTRLHCVTSQKTIS